MTNKIQISLSLDSEVINRVFDKASKDRRATSYTINEILKKYFKIK